MRWSICFALFSSWWENQNDALNEMPFLVFNLKTSWCEEDETKKLGKPVRKKSQNTFLLHLSLLFDIWCLSLWRKCQYCWMTTFLGFFCSLWRQVSGCQSQNFHECCVEEHPPPLSLMLLLLSTFPIRFLCKKNYYIVQ